MVVRMVSRQIWGEGVTEIREESFHETYLTFDVGLITFWDNFVVRVLPSRWSNFLNTV